MGLFDFLSGALNKLEEHGPEIMDYMQKAQDRAQEKEARKQSEIGAYRARYSGMSNQELQARVDQGVSGAERAAIASIAQEHRNEREKLQEFYSCMSSLELRIEYKKVSSQKRQGMLEMPNADLRLAIISKMLKERGWHLNQNLEWCEY